MRFLVLDERAELISGGMIKKIIGSVKAYGPTELAESPVWWIQHLESKAVVIEADDRRDAVDRYLQVLKVEKLVEASL